MHLREHLSELADVVAVNGLWMVWNTFLAWIPVLLALVLFRPWERSSRPARRTWMWWFGLVVFVLFLPNAPYVLTDLVHLRDDVLLAGQHGRVVTTVLPVYGLLVASGFLAYTLALAQLTHYLGRAGLAHRRTQITYALHGLVAVGIFLGRWSRLNSWEPLLRPRNAFGIVVDAFSWSAAPLLIAVLFVATAAGHFATRAIVDAAWTRVTAWLGRTDPNLGC